MDALVQAPWVCLPWQTRYLLDSGSGRTRPISPQQRMLVSSSIMLTEAAVQGLGLAVKSQLAIVDELKSGQLVEVMPGILAQNEAPVWFVSTPEARIGRKTRLFGELVERAFTQFR